MKLEISPTGRFENVNGQRCRLWTGLSDKGVPVECFVALVQVPADADQSAFNRELRNVPLERQPVVFDHRFVT